jgi:aminoglycoside phosphotransferase (APT) family kinase protein
MQAVDTVDFDTEALARWFGKTVSDARGAMRLTRIQGGQSNPTFFVDLENASFVLRKQPPGELLPSAHQIDREFRVMRALAATDVPVPTMIALEMDNSVIGTTFYVMQKLVGRVMPAYGLPEVPIIERAAYQRELARVLARLHAADWQALGLDDFGKPGNYFARQIARWTKQWQSSKLAENADMDHLIDWLPQNLPRHDDETAIAHGDYRMGNVIWHPNEPRIIGVLDWELSTLGHPMADLAYACMSWHFPPHIYDGLLGVDLTAHGLLTQNEFVAAYAQARGGAVELQPFHLAFSMFRFAAILEGVAARAKAGNAANHDAAKVGGLASAFARRAMEIVRG